MRKKIVAGNWKMNKTLKDGKALADEIIGKSANLAEHKRVILIPPFIHLTSVGKIAHGSGIAVGSQNNHAEKSGAYTGEVSAEMLQSVGVSYGLVGHSERRTYQAEKDDELLAKTKALLAYSIKPIFCCGEHLNERKSAQHFQTVENQLQILWSLNPDDFRQIVIAYEPVWAIGTGETASSNQAQEMHAFIRGLIEQQMGKEIAEQTSILYGGSCKPSNAEELFAKHDVDGGLIGGASLNAEDFLAIIDALD